MSEQPLGMVDTPSTSTESSDYNVNFFKPKTAHSRANMNMIISMVLVWALAVFGFQVLLMVFNQPTPEEGYTTFESVWPKVKDGSASVQEKQEFAKVCLNVLGKNIVLTDTQKILLKDSLTQTLLGLVPSEKQSIITGDDKQAAVTLAKNVIGLQVSGFDTLRADLLPYSIISNPSEEYSDELPAIMELYLVHNQSFLTDMRFIGFPFHYWYTAQFLLILFVGLCLIYAYKTDRSNKKYNFPDE